jgi:Cu/Ag efflux protein CusF
MRFFFLAAAALCLIACRSENSETTVLKEEPLRRYELKGEVLSLDNEGKIAKIKHEQIGDWMSPMTMDFPVKDEAEFAKLKAGEQIEGTVFVQGLSYWAGEFKPASPPAESK